MAPRSPLGVAGTALVAMVVLTAFLKFILSTPSTGGVALMSNSQMHIRVNTSYDVCSKL